MSRGPIIGLCAGLMTGLACAILAQADSPVASPRGLDGFVTVDRLPVPQDPYLAAGRAVWGDSCENCHGGNRAVGAPKITATRSWAPRIAQGMPVLIDHALNGFVGPKYTQMPARGANPDLSDTQVAQAVAFMVWASGGSDIAETFIDTQNGDSQ